MSLYPKPTPEETERAKEAIDAWCANADVRIRWAEYPGSIFLVSNRAEKGKMMPGWEERLFRTGLGNTLQEAWEDFLRRLVAMRLGVGA